MSAIFALLIRNLRVEGRSYKNYALRFAILAICIFIFFSTNCISYRSTNGREAFIALIWLNFIIITTIGASLFCSVITEEKENGSLGILRLTSISSLGIVLGKSMSRMITMLMLLVIQLPFVILSITLGGVSHGMILSAFLSIAAFTIMLSGLGVLLSTFMKNSRNALTGYIFFLLLHLIIPLMYAIIISLLEARGIISRNGNLYQSMAGFYRVIYELTPLHSLVNISSLSFGGEIFWGQIAVNLGMGILFYALAWQIFEKFSLRTPQKKSKVAAFVKRKKLRSILLPKRCWSRYPIVWKELCFMSNFSITALLKLTIFLIFLIVFRKYLEAVAMISIITVLYIIPIEIIYHFGYLLNREVKLRTLPDLIILPMKTKSLVWQKGLSLFIYIIPNILVVAISAIILLVLKAENLDYMIENVIDDMEIGVGLGLGIIIGSLFLLSLIHAHLAIFLKRGAFILTIIGSYFSVLIVTLFTSLIFYYDIYNGLFILIVILVAELWGIYFLIARLPYQLEKKAPNC